MSCRCLKHQNRRGLNASVWIDCRSLHMAQDELMDMFLNQCGLYLNSGLDYGEGGRGFVRINMACPRAYVEKALEKMKYGIK